MIRHNHRTVIIFETSMNDGAPSTLPQATQSWFFIRILPVLIFFGALNFIYARLIKNEKKKVRLGKNKINERKDVPHRRCRKYTVRKVRSRISLQKLRRGILIESILFAWMIVDKYSSIMLVNNEYFSPGSRR
ncbi:hypothetical protein PUN28_017465 [Cardiocondyla obscurior]|uniref:Transmembrane protein n=1 Tax=Cardiocondyla obscurior TaxID=286306 RepID=A0AAW2ELC5_9HYME